VGDGVLAAQEHRGEVDLLHPAPHVQVGVQQGVVLGGRDARVVEGHVQAAVGLDRGVEQGDDLVLDRDVDRDEQPADLLGRGGARGFVHVAHHHPRALGGQAAGRGEADPAAAPGDDHDPILQAAHIWLLSVAMKTFLTSV
jgi:hypothetical protein